MVTRTLAALLLWSAAVPALSQPLTEASLAARLGTPDGGTGFYLEPVTPSGALFLPVDVAVAPDGRYFVAEKNGTVRVVMPDGTVQPEHFLDLSAEVYENGDRGLLGIALHPDFETTPYVYLTYTVDDGPLPRPATGFRAYARLTRYTASTADPNVADQASRRVLIGETAATGIPACYNSHTIGTILFGHDGSLFLGSGEAASWAEPDAGGLYDECFDGYVDPAQDIGSFRAQWTGSLAGKVLRLDPETGLGLSDNPLYTGDPEDWASRVWVLGLRNPFRYALAPLADGETGPGTLYIGDVGQGDFEEINRAHGGENFGWPCYEGPRRTPSFVEVEAPVGFDCSLPREGVLTAPYAYFHHYLTDSSAPSGRVATSITGGAFYQGAAYPERFRGALFYADYSFGWISVGQPAELALDAVEEVVSEAGPIVDLAYDPTTETLVGVDIASGQLVRIQHSGGGPVPPVARASASVTQGVVPLTVTFSADGSFDPDGSDLTYHWSFGWSDAAEGPEVTYQYYLPGSFAATLTVTDADGAQSQTVLPIRVGTSMPEIRLVEPTGYVIGSDGAFRVAATASDPEEDPADLRVSWAISLVHNEHEHPYFYTTTGAEGSFVVQPHASAGEVAYYRATATVVDREGLQAHVERTMREDNPLDIDVGLAARMEGDTVSFSRPLRVGRLTLPNVAAVPDSLTVEARQGGAWQPVRYLHALPEGDDLQLLFAEVEADAFRVGGAEGHVGVHAHLDPEAELEGGWTPADVGAPVVPGRTVPTEGGGLVLVGGGALAAGAYHFAPAPLAGDGAVAARVDAVDGGARAGAGVAMRTSLHADAEGVGLFAGDGLLRVHHGGEADTLHTEVRLPLWVRLRRIGEKVGAEISSDGEKWGLIWSGSMPTGALLAGPAAVGGDRQSEGRVAVAWVNEVSLEAGDAGVETHGQFDVLAPYPNPARSGSTLPLVAGREGVYEVRVVDRLGRVVLGPLRYDVGFPAHVDVGLDVGGLSSGVYLLHVVHRESGDDQTQTITVIH